jgi:hypothetical protein
MQRVATLVTPSPRGSGPQQPTTMRAPVVFMPKSPSMLQLLPNMSPTKEAYGGISTPLNPCQTGTGCPPITPPEQMAQGTHEQDPPDACIRPTDQVQGEARGEVGPEKVHRKHVLTEPLP